jgi:hypothetical protein
LIAAGRTQFLEGVPATAGSIALIQGAVVTVIGADDAAGFKVGKTDTSPVAGIRVVAVRIGAAPAGRSRSFVGMDAPPGAVADIIGAIVAVFGA